MRTAAFEREASRGFSFSIMGEAMEISNTGNTAWMVRATTCRVAVLLRKLRKSNLSQLIRIISFAAFSPSLPSIAALCHKYRRHWTSKHRLGVASQPSDGIVRTRQTVCFCLSACRAATRANRLSTLVLFTLVCDYFFADMKLLRTALRRLDELRRLAAQHSSK